MNTPRRHPPRRPRAAFTLTELLVVILILVTVLLIAVPAFSSLMYSSEASMAESLLRSALRAGRDAAIRSAGRSDAGIVFFFEPGGRTLLVPCVKAGELEEGTLNRPTVIEIWIPSDTLEPVQLPKNWMVRGYAPVNSISPLPLGTLWYEGPRIIGGGGYGMSSTRGDWVFPETGFYDVESGRDGQKRQTFMIRFEAGTGLLSTAYSAPVLVLSPRPSATGRSPVGSDQWKRADLASDYSRFVRRVLTDNSIRLFERQALLGSVSSDMVRAKAVSQIALYDEKKLAAGLGVHPDRDTGCLYTVTRAGPGNVTVLWVRGALVDAAHMNAWIEGDTDFDGRIESPSATGDSPQAKMFTIDRYTAVLHEVEAQP
jgi:type II secretory pathway pseudopilin PulG